jgi:hypothetical protein
MGVELAGFQKQGNIYVLLLGKITADCDKITADCQKITADCEK